jgi:hypothetical protein
MAESEASFRDRQGKAQSLRDATAGFTPAFAPADTSLTATNFNTFIGTVGTANTSVETLAVNYTTSATTRVALVKAIRSAVTQALGFVKSNKAWINQFKAAKMAADKLRGVRPSSNTEPPPTPQPGAPAPEPEKSRNKGEQAYVELTAHLGAFITAITACAGYAPTSADISISTFNGLLSQFNGLNGFISQLSSQLTTARENRRRLYFEGDCLQTKFQAVKDAVKGQYGQNGSQYGTVKGIKW